MHDRKGKTHQRLNTIGRYGDVVRVNLLGSIHNDTQSPETTNSPNLRGEISQTCNFYFNTKRLVNFSTSTLTFLYLYSPADFLQGYSIK